MDKSIIIAGAGPAGLLLAREMAKAGWTVNVFEAKAQEQLTEQHDWSDAVEYSVLQEAGLPVPVKKETYFEGDGVKESIDGDGLYEPHRISDLQVYSPDYKARIKGKVEFPMILIDRVALSKYQLKQAEEAGAKVHFGCPVITLTGDLSGDIGDIKVTGCEVKRSAQQNTNGDGQQSNTTETISADVIVDATGHRSVLRQTLGCPAIAAPFDDGDFANVTRKVYRFDTLKTDSQYPTVDHYSYGKYSGYSWTHFHRDGVIDIGCGVSSWHTPAEAQQAQDFMAKALGVGEKLRGVRGVSERVLVGASPPALATSGFMVLGDAAAMTNSMNGCGVAGAMRGALIAANVLKNASDCSIASLWPYAAQWFRGIGAHYASLRAMSRALQKLTHDDVRFMIGRGILGAAMMQNNLAGRFAAPGIGDSLRTLFACLGGNMPLLSMLMNAQGKAKRVHKLCRQYPEAFDPASFQAFCQAYQK